MIVNHHLLGARRFLFKLFSFWENIFEIDLMNIDRTDEKDDNEVRFGREIHELS